MFALPSRCKVCITSNWHVVVLPDWTLLAIHGVHHFSGPFFFGIVPRLQPHLPLGYVGGAYERSGWCFVEACAVSCEQSKQTQTLVTHLCFFRVCPMRRRARCRSEGLLHELSVCVWVLLTHPGVHFVGHQGWQLSFGPGEAAGRQTRHHPVRGRLVRHEGSVQQWPHAAPHARRR